MSFYPEKHKSHPYQAAFILWVRKAGLEPARPCERHPLKMVRLPISPLPRWLRLMLTLSNYKNTTLWQIGKMKNGKGWIITINSTVQYYGSSIPKGCQYYRKIIQLQDKSRRDDTNEAIGKLIKLTSIVISSFQDYWLKKWRFPTGYHRVLPQSSQRK